MRNVGRMKKGSESGPYKRRMLELKEVYATILYFLCVDGGGGFQMW